jgi:hypothetical protein
VGGGANPTCANPGGKPTKAATGMVDVWQNVTPAGVDLAHDYGAQDVLVDPVRPSDLYAFVCRQGVWKSTDYGATWAHISTGAGAPALEKGRPWSAGIDSNPCRDPNTPPTLYTFSGYGSLGFFRSNDGGVSWTRTEFPSIAGAYPQDGYTVDVDPNDGKHLIVGWHGAAAMVESGDGGSTWRIVPGPKGDSVYYFFINTGDPATTRTTWLGIGESGAMTRTTNSGATWSVINTLQHGHGCSQIFQAGGGVLYVAGSYGTEGGGIYRSTDYGATIKRVLDTSANGVLGTPKNIYSTWAWANAGGADPSIQRSARGSGTAWTPMAHPPGMSNGSKRATVTFDGTHYIIVSGNWNAGIWRYIEP